MAKPKAGDKIYVFSTLHVSHLEPKQEALKAAFGEQQGYPEPDTRPEFNRWDVDPE